MVLVAASVGVAAIGNDYRFDAREVTIPVSNGGTLEGVLTTPERGDAQGLVVMLHGDGPIDATHGGLYNPWFEGAAEAGWATLSWSKPGVGSSSGDWLAQSMADRAAEAEQVVNWARGYTDIPTQRIVLWGASQSGWVLPAIVAHNEDIAGVVAVGTAVNWLRQGQYNLQAELDHKVADDTERWNAKEESARTNALLERGANYEEYRDTAHETDPMTRERWTFVSRNFRSDAEHDLRAAAQRQIPWHLMAGKHDRNVDMTETARVYQGILDDQFTTTTLNAAHSMARPIMEDSELIGLITGVFWPRALLAPGVIKDYQTFLKQL
ncbi:alpha/beta hydrolase [Arthrobacter sp. MYb227]|nr:alpha/beta hydrolase [Arthrobacter sp. MYb227]